MAYASLRECVLDLEKTGQLRVIDAEIDADLEAAAIHRRVFAAGGPALLFRRVKGCAFPMVSNLFGTKERAYYILRHGLEAARALVDARTKPAALLQSPARTLSLPSAALHAVPRFVRSGPALESETRISALPQVRCWPRDGGAFVLLPQVYTEHPDSPGVFKSNLGMYRVQLSGNEYATDREIGLHYQIHRGIGVHHQAALARGEALRVNVFVGGPPAYSVAAVLPLPEGMPEILFGGVLAGRAPRLVRGAPCIHADADFVIRGVVEAGVTKPEGPFGDHLGYYSEAHPFPFLRVEAVTHRRDAIWPFTVVGRPPQEDTIFGALVHDLFASAVTNVLPGVRAVHAVDEAGVHPLLLAIGSERYAPHAKSSRPMELLTQANAILGQGQLSLSKYVFIVDGADAPGLDVHDVGAFLRHVLERFDPTRDLHFQTQTTIDTLDYSGSALNEGSKVVVAARGPKARELGTAVASGLPLPNGFRDPRVVMPGVLTISAPRFAMGDGSAERFCAAFARDAISGFPLVVLVDDSEFSSRSLANFLWVTFTRSDPAPHVHGIGASVRDKAWGCTGSVVIDARVKPGHPPALEEAPSVTARVEAMAARGGPLAGLF